MKSQPCHTFLIASGVPTRCGPGQKEGSVSAFRSHRRLSNGMAVLCPLKVKSAKVVPSPSSFKPQANPKFLSSFQTGFRFICHIDMDEWRPIVLKAIRKLIFWVHLTLGCVAGLVILAMSVTGFLLPLKGRLTTGQTRRQSCRGNPIHPRMRRSILYWRLSKTMDKVCQRNWSCTATKCAGRSPFWTRPYALLEPLDGRNYRAAF